MPCILSDGHGYSNVGRTFWLIRVSRHAYSTVPSSTWPPGESEACYRQFVHVAPRNGDPTSSFGTLPHLDPEGIQL